MKAFGADRTYAKCIVTRAGFGKKILVKLFVKGQKSARRWSINKEE